MNIDAPFGIELRVVEDGQREQQPVRVVSGSRLYETDQEDLWDALSNSDRIARWFLPISGDLKPGGRFQLEGNAGGEIKQCDGPNMFEVTWECSGNVSWVKVTLSPEDGKTRLTLAHTMTKDEASESHWKKYGPGATGVGWDLGFLGLGIHLETGNPVPQAEFHGWMASEEGKTFSRKCAQSWAESHVKSGESPEVANEMAEQTAKAYCGE